jgi:NAD(P)H dehydrogenase (quinone)
MTNIAIVYYSATGNIAAMANAIGEGAASVGAEVRVRQVAETAPAEAIASNPKWQAHFDAMVNEPVATLDDLEWADGIALGSPTRFGGPASQLKSFLDTTGGLWFKGALVNTVGTAFTTASTAHGGLESTTLAINNHFYHWGSLIMPLGYGDEHVSKVSGNPYGASHVSRKGSVPDEDALKACFVQGRQLAQVSSWVAAGKSGA